MHIKICGLCRPVDAQLSAAAGATHAGVIRVPGTIRYRPVEEAREVLDAAAGLRRVGVFAGADAALLERESSELALDVIQLHGGEDPETVESARRLGLEVWKVVKPATGADLLAAAHRYRAADLLLIEGASDAGLGGVGATFDWRAIAAVRDRLPPGVRIGIAGGLTPENVDAAVGALDPALVDVSSGVEAAPGEKDEGKVRAFIDRARTHTGIGEGR